MGNFDEVSAQFLKDRYGPFAAYVRRRVRVTCDFCNEEITTGVSLTSKRSDRSLTCCLGNCLSFMVGEEKAKTITFSVATERKGLGVAPGTVSSKVMISVKDEVTKALNYKTAGFGKKWHSIGSILDWHIKGNTLSDKQLAVLVKFNKSCAKEAEET
jgi:hypothetical protein